MSKSPERVLGVGAVGDIDNPGAKGSTQQPALKDSPEKAGKTPEEQAAADSRAAKKENS